MATWDVVVLGKFRKLCTCGTPVAVKNILNNNAFALIREVKILESLRHPNIVSMIAPSNSEIVMELYGENARNIEYLEEFTIIGRDCMRAIVYMQIHGECLSHGNIKPDNILVDFDDNTDSITKAYLGDVGLARACKAHEGFRGTAGFMPHP